MRKKLDPSMNAREIAFSLKELLRGGVCADECLREIERSVRLMWYDGETRINMRNAVGDCVFSLFAYGADAGLCSECVTPVCLDKNLWLFLKKGASPMSCLEKLGGHSVKKHENLRLLVHYGIRPDDLIKKCVRSGVTLSDPGSINLLLRFGAEPVLLMSAMTGDSIAESLKTLLRHGARPNDCIKRMKKRDVRRLGSMLVGSRSSAARFAP